MVSQLKKKAVDITNLLEDRGDSLKDWSVCFTGESIGFYSHHYWVH